MQRYFIHCFLHAESRGMRVIYVGKCEQEEAEARFEQATRECSEFELISLHDGSGREIRRRNTPPAEASPARPLRTWMSVRLWPHPA
ncbi:hypothetical protein [Endothiovibrio diazotrophicus]